MLYSLRGKLIYTDHHAAVVECGGVGYKCAASAATLAALPKLGEEAFLYTHMNVREDAVELFGFSSAVELDSFKMLISVNGVGPKAALAILSALSPDKFALSVAAGDVKALTAAQGVGPKLAQRIVLELKDKISNERLAESVGGEMGAVSPVRSSSNTGEAVSALMALGYSQTEAASAVAKMDASLSVEELIKGALKAFAKRG